MSGSQTGIADIGKRLAQENKECPDEKFALVGYSQGGMVVLSSLAAIPAEISKKVVAVVLYGAGDGSVVTGSFKEKVLANCAPGDFVSFDLMEGMTQTNRGSKGMSKGRFRTRPCVI
jgi:pimeloyl-ACP methyl ester carboxylesterase